MLNFRHKAALDCTISISLLFVGNTNRALQVRFQLDGKPQPICPWQMRQIIATLRKQGKILLICSHYLPEVEMLRDTVAILHHGKLVQSGAVSDFVHTQNVVEIVLPEGHVAGDIVIQPAIAEHVVEMQNNLIRISSKSQDNVLATFSAANIQIHSLNPISKTLEVVYINTT